MPSRNHPRQGASDGYERSLPPGVAWHCLDGLDGLDGAASAGLRRWIAAFPSAPLVAAAHREQFLAGRYCAAQAIARLLGGPVSGSIGRDAEGAPVWPAGCVGSITHTDGFISAAVARKRDFVALGIDSEMMPGGATAADIEAQILGAGEAAMIVREGLSREEAVFLAFSAKESLYKCVRPLVDRFFGFRDAELARIEPGRGELDLRLRAPLADAFPAGASFEGRFCFEAGRVHTSVFIPAGERPAF